jgi:hypothetical protein
LTLEWEAPDGADERTTAAEAVSALFSFTGSWLEPLAIALRVSYYDPEIFSAGEYLVPNIPKPFHFLARERRPEGVTIEPMYLRSIESHAPSLIKDTVQSWMDGALAQPWSDGTRFVTSLRELDVRASTVLLPPGWTDGDQLSLECYAGTVRIPLERRGDNAWVAAPSMRYGLDQPVVIKLENCDGWLRFSIDIYWSPWVEELDRPESPLAKAIGRLAARGWHPSSD